MSRIVGNRNHVTVQLILRENVYIFSEDREEALMLLYFFLNL